MKSWDFETRLQGVNWSLHETAYGSATSVADQLRRLNDDDTELALQASNDLWGGLCHQHAYVSSAALPALPFILHVLKKANAQLTVEILDILLGFALCTVPHPETSLSPWQSRLWSELEKSQPLIEAHQDADDDDARFFAREILKLLGSAPSESCGGQ